MFKYRSFLIACILLFLVAGQSFSQNFSADVSLIPDFENADTLARKFSLSLSGQQLAYLTDVQLCVYDLDTQSNSCTALPWEDDFTTTFANIGFISLEWSYDEQYIAISKYPFTNPRYDTDIWLYTIDTQQFQNLSDDNITGRYDPLAPDPSMMIDFLPIWDALSQNIYFFRATLDSNGVVVSDGIYSVSILNGDVQLIQSLPNGYTSFFGIASMSPDKQKIAMILSDVNGDYENNAVWVLDLENLELREIASISAFDEG